MHPHSRLIPVLGIASLWLSASVNATPAVPAIPKVPQVASTLEGLVPSGWSVLAKAEGDLNRDGKADGVLVLKSADEDREDQSEEIPRLLVLALRTEKGFAVSAVSEKAIFCKTCGGTLGDPFQEVKVERGTVVIDLMGGSRERWSIRLRLRLQGDGAKQDWFLIGWTSEIFDRANGASSRKDFNLLTGDVVQFEEEVTEDDEHLPPKTTRTKRKPLTLRLRDYNPDQPLL